MEDKDYYLLLKWGTVKGWCVPKGKCQDLLQEYFKEGSPMSCATDRPDEARRKILCELIDIFDGPITNDWTGKKMTKKQAKKYITEY